MEFSTMSNSTGSSRNSVSDNLPVGAILAGGASRRMGEAKAMMRLGGKPLLERVVERIALQVSSVVVVGGPPVWAEHRGLDYRADAIAGGRGPLAGLLAAMDFAEQTRSNSDFVFVAATDMPFLPPDLVSRLLEESDKGLPVIPRSGNRLQPLAALWPRDIHNKITSGLRGKSIESMKDLYQDTGFREVSFETGPLDPFFNVNTPEDLGVAERWLGI